MKRRNQCYFKQRTKNIEEIFKGDQNYINFQNDLRQTNSKSCRLETFQEYVRVKNKMDYELLQKFEHTYLMKLRWRTYIRTQKSEQKLQDKITETFDPFKLQIPPIILGLGDWSETETKKFKLPTPSKRMCRLLSRKFDVYRTSKTCSICKDSDTKEFFYRDHPNPHRLDDSGNRIRKRVRTLLTCQKCNQNELFNS